MTGDCSLKRACNKCPCRWASTLYPVERQLWLIDSCFGRKKTDFRQSCPTTANRFVRCDVLAQITKKQTRAWPPTASPSGGSRWSLHSFTHFQCSGGISSTRWAAASPRNSLVASQQLSLVALPEKKSLVWGWQWIKTLFVRLCPGDVLIALDYVSIWA